MTLLDRVPSETDGESLLFALEVVEQVDHPAVGVNFNLCHWLWLEGEQNLAKRLDAIMPVDVDPLRGAVGAWYEFFPRSCSPAEGKHGSFRDAEERLGHAVRMGFEVVYLPPIHPIGVTDRKGPNNSLDCPPGSPGCPYAIGSAAGNGIHRVDRWQALPPAHGHAAECGR